MCELVPNPQSELLQTKTDDLNNQIKKWGDVNGVSVIQPGLAFQLGTAEIDEACYLLHEQHQAALLNRFGAVRLLNSIGKHCDKLKACINWANLRHQPLNQQRQAPLTSHQPQHGSTRGWQVAGKRRRGSGRDSPNDSTSRSTVFYHLPAQPSQPSPPGSCPVYPRPYPTPTTPCLKAT